MRQDINKNNWKTTAQLEPTKIYHLQQVSVNREENLIPMVIPSPFFELIRALKLSYTLVGRKKDYVQLSLTFEKL